MTTQKLIQFENNYADQVAPFYVNLAKGDCMIVNGNPMLREEYNLIISKRDFNLFAAGLKPHRYWSFNATKKYYGLKGNAQKVADQVNEMVEVWKLFKDIHVTYEN